MSDNILNYENMGRQNWVVSFFKKVFSTFKNLSVRFFYWLKFPVPRWRPAAATVLLLAMIWSLLLYGGQPSYAASYLFVQSDWSGGVSATTIGHPTNETGWNKYSEANQANVSTTVKTATYSTTKDENFTTTDTTADKDAVNTTAAWSASNAIQIPAISGLVGYWKLDEGSGTTANDSSGNGYNGTLVSGSAYSSNVPNTSFSDPYSGSFTASRGVTLTTSADLDPTYPKTYSAWIKTSDVNVSQGSYFWSSSKTWDPTRRLELGISAGQFVVVVNNSGGGGPVLTGGTAVNNVWYHYAFVESSSTSGTLYINGSSVATSNSLNLSSIQTGATKIIGGDIFISGFTNTMNGIDDVRVYSRALTPTEVGYLASGLSGLNDGSNNTAQSIKVNTGTENIESVTLTKSDTVGTGTVTYYVSNNGGSAFSQVTPSSLYTFGSLGNDLRWKAVFTGDATVSSLSLAYTGYYSSGDLTSSAYDTSDTGNLIAKLAWTATGESASEIVKFQIRTSADGVTWSNWCGASDTGSSCTGSNYFTSAYNNVAIAVANPVRSGSDDQWLQYKAFLLSGGGATATLSSVTVTYVVNAPPEFNSVNGLVVSQITDANDSNYGKVAIVYSIRDTDTSTGTTNPGFITPSFEYNVGAGYVSITSGYLSTNATTVKAVDGSSYTDYTAYWDAKSQIPTNYLTNAKVRVTINDNEAANNTAQSASANFTLDTKNPTISAFTINGPANTLTLTAADDTTVQYMLSNNADFSADGLNATSGQWQDAGGTSISLSPSWSFAATPAESTVYLQVRDTSNNVATSTGVAPSAPDKMYIRDISDAEKETFAIFVSWEVYSSVTGSTFQKYEVYRSTDDSSYSLVSTITDRTINYYPDFNLTQDQTYYYKIRTFDTDSDIGAYSSVVSQAAHGGGGGTQNVDPVIGNVTVVEAQSTRATISWETDVLSDSRVDYSIAPSASFSLGGHSVASFVTQHSVTLTGLTPNTNYLFEVRSTDEFDNTGTNDNSAAGFSFTTSGGPVISNVTQSAINDNSAQIVWNTDRDSDSYVTYSTNADLSSSTRVGSSSLVGGSNPFNHTVSLTGLSAGTVYYYFVESTDGSHNYSNDTNGGAYYDFTTPVDTAAPIISDVDAPVISYTAAVITYTTDKPGTTQLSYGTTSGSYTTTTTIDTTLTISHAVALNGLEQEKKYYFIVKSKSAGGYEGTSSEDDFTTGAPVVVGSTSGGGGGSSSTADTTAPTITNIKKQNITSFKAEIAFATNEDTVAIIQYGQDAAVLLQSAGSAKYTQSHAITLSGLTTGTKYTFTITAVDRGGNTTTSQADDFTTKFFTEGKIDISDASAFQKEIEDAIENALPSLVPPFIEKPRITDITDSAATVTWRTNVKAYSAVAYASEDKYDATKTNPYETEIADTTNRVLDHLLTLTGLKSNTTYHLIVKAFTLPQLQNKTQDLEFNTLAPKFKALIGEVKNNSFRAVWTTLDATTSVVEYKNTKTGETNQKALEERTLDHDILVENLVPGTTYEVNVFGFNAKGNQVSTSSAVRITTSVDTTPPVIAGLKISSALLPGQGNRTQTIISWETDEPANSTIFYAEGSAKPDETLPNKVEIAETYSREHAVVVSTLKPGGLYSIQVQSVDIAGNKTLLPTRSIVVPRQAESALDLIFGNFKKTFEFLPGI